VTLAPYHTMNQRIFTATITIMKRFHLIYHHHKQHHERSMEHHQTIKRRDSVADNRASSLTSPELTFRARRPQIGHPNFQHIL
jgi:hypothetical protein